MAKKKSGNSRNDDRPNGKAWKKNPKTNKKTGKTIKGFSPAKILIRKNKRSS